MRAIPLLSLLLSGWFIVPAHADEAQDWLKRLGQAEQQQSFQGTFVYERNGSFSTHNIWHRVQDGQVRERLIQLDGSAQEVVRVDGRTQCVSGTLVAGLGMPPTLRPTHSIQKSSRIGTTLPSSASRVWLGVRRSLFP